MIWLGEALFWKYLIIDICIYWNISIFFIHFDNTSVVLGLGTLLLLPSELIPVSWACVWAENEYLNYCHKCFLLFLMGIWDIVGFFPDTVHCKSYSLNSSNRRTTFLFLHGQTDTERTWAAHFISSVIPSCYGTPLITCALMCIWSFSCLFLLLFCTFERCNYFGASAGCLHWESEK